MKKIIIIVVVLAAGYFIYNKFYNVIPFEIEDKLIVSQSSGLDISAGITPPPKFASVEGILKNTGEKALSHIIIFYSVGIDTISASVGFLMPDETTQFKTNSCRVRAANSKYSLIEVKFEEADN